MQRNLLIVLLFVCHASFGQDFSLNHFLSWFEKADVQSVKTAFQNTNYSLIEEKDSLDLHLLRYKFLKQGVALQPGFTFLIGDSAVEYLSIGDMDQNVHKAMTAQLKGNRFKTLNADVNGDFITTVYDNDRIVLNQDYQAIDNPSGKGQLSSYGYRIYRKYGQFDTMNGEKMVMLSENGKEYLAIRENYKNGVLSGERTFYYPNGTVRRKENYQAGRLNGLVSDYNEQGQLIHSVTHSYHWKYGMEKWYDRQGKVVKTLQWQRDVPVGTEKQTFNGTVVGSIPYVKGIKHGPAKIAVYFDEHILASYPLDTLNDAPFGIETVNFENGVRNGKAVCMDFNSTDTMYTCYYKAGKRDSTYTRYGQNSVYYTTNYVNGLENGSRVFRIPSGPLKDTVYQVEQYKNGKLHGVVIQYYRKEEDQLLIDPDPGFHLEGSSSGYPKFLPGQWRPNYSFETYENGVPNGPYFFRQDSMNYHKGAYVHGKLDGLIEAGMVFGEKWIRETKHYDKGIRTGEWTTENVFDSILEIEHYENDQKHGVYTKFVKGFKVEERHYYHDTLRFEEFDEPNGDFRSWSLETKRGQEELRVIKNRTGDTLSMFTDIIGNIPEPYTVHHGAFSVETSQYQKIGSYTNGKLDGTLQIKHKNAEVIEISSYENGSLMSSSYSRLEDHQPYSGIFISAITGESISVKDGLRHGWCIQYDKTGIELRRTKYVNGIYKRQKT